MTIIHNRNQDRIYDKYTGKLFAWFLTLNILNIVIKQTFPNAMFISLLTPLFGIIYLFIFFLYGYYVRKSFCSILILELIFLLLLVISLIRNNSSATVIIHRTIWTLCFCIPLAVTSFYVVDYKEYLEQTRFANNLTFFAGIFSFFRTYFVDGEFTYENYNMEVCYALLMPLFFHIYSIKSKRVYAVISLVEIAVIAVYGSRGQLLCIATYLFLLFIKNRNREKKVLIAVSVAVIAGVGLLLSSQILTRLSSIVGRLGSRTLSMLLQGRITYDSGRMEIWIEALNKVLDHPLAGLGVAGELTYLTSSPHNLFIELIVHYGILIGTLLIIAVLIYIFLFILKRLNGEREIMIIMTSSLIPLMLSSTYLQTPGFWISIAMISAQTIFIRDGKIIVKSGTDKKSIRNGALV